MGEAVSGDDIGARGVAIAEDARDVAGCADRLHEFRLEGVALRREVAPVEGDGRAGDLPVTRGRVLAVRHFAGRAVIAEDARRNVHALWKAAGRGACGMQEPEGRHVGKLQRALPQPRTVGRARRAELGDMAQRVGAKIAEGGRIRPAADAEGIENEEKGPRQWITCRLSASA
jgi:hypothetical protein